MLDFDIIFGMDWLHKFYATTEYRNSVVSFKFPNKLDLEWKGHSPNPTVQIFPILKPTRYYVRG